MARGDIARTVRIHGESSVVTLDAFPLHASFEQSQVKPRMGIGSATTAKVRLSACSCAIIR